MTNKPVSRKKNLVDGKGKIEKREAIESEIKETVRKNKCVISNILNIFKR